MNPAEFIEPNIPPARIEHTLSLIHNIRHPLAGSKVVFLFKGSLRNTCINVTGGFCPMTALLIAYILIEDARSSRLALSQNPHGHIAQLFLNEP